jgi:hypothetical protein
MQFVIAQVLIPKNFREQEKAARVNYVASTGYEGTTLIAWNHLNGHTIENYLSEHFSRVLDLARPHGWEFISRHEDTGLKLHHEDGTGPYLTTMRFDYDSEGV